MDCVECKMPTDDKTICGCDPTLCVHCCKCQPDCECDCTAKSETAIVALKE